LEFKDVRLNNLKGVSLEVMAVVREWFDLQGETNQDIGSNRKDYSHPKPASSVEPPHRGRSHLGA
jgi:hypothetical protein